MFYGRQVSKLQRKKKVVEGLDYCSFEISVKICVVRLWHFQANFSNLIKQPFQLSDVAIDDCRGNMKQFRHMKK